MGTATSMLAKGGRNPRDKVHPASSSTHTLFHHSSLPDVQYVIGPEVLEVWRTALAMSKSDVLLETLREFFNKPQNASILMDVLVDRNGVSLRKLESFITVYSKKNNVSYTTKTGKMFVVHVAYKSSLVGYSKRLFDPFCRTERIEFQVSPDVVITTTVAQLNFIKWCITNEVIDYVKQSSHTSALRSDTL
jgi:hypothetical protein